MYGQENMYFAFTNYKSLMCRNKILPLDGWRTWRQRNNVVIQMDLVTHGKARSTFGITIV